MTKDFIRGLFSGLLMILIVVAIGTSIGFACKDQDPQALPHVSEREGAQE